MYTVKSNNGQTWVVPLALFCLGMDGLALVVLVKARAASYVTTPILVAWQVVALICFFRGFLPAYKRLDETHPALSELYLSLFRTVQILPTIISVMLSYAVSVVHRA